MTQRDNFINKERKFLFEVFMRHEAMITTYLNFAAYKDFC